VLAWLGAFVVFHLLAPAVASRRGATLGEAGRDGRLAAPVLLFMFTVLVAREPAAAEPAVLFGALLGLLAVIAAAAIGFGDGRLHFGAAALALAAEATWSAKYLTPARLLPALLLYGGFGLFYVGV